MIVFNALLDLRLDVAGSPLDEDSKQYVIGLIDERLKEASSFGV